MIKQFYTLSIHLPDPKNFGPPLSPRESDHIVARVQESLPGVLKWLSAVDEKFAAGVVPKLQSFADVDSLQADYINKLSDQQRQELKGLVEQVQKRIGDQRDHYIAASDQESWRTADALVADLVTVVHQYQNTYDRVQMLTVRDSSMAENVGWILQHEGPGARIVVWAHNGHVKRVSDGGMGSYLAERFGRDLCVFGFAFNRGSFQAIAMPGKDGRPPAKAGLQEFSVGESAPGSLDYALSQVGQLFVLDLRNAPTDAGVRHWLATTRPTRTIGATFSHDHEDIFFNQVQPAELYDALVFVNATTRARPVARMANPATTQSS